MEKNAGKFVIVIVLLRHVLDVDRHHHCIKQKKNRNYTVIEKNLYETKVTSERNGRKWKKSTTQDQIEKKEKKKGKNISKVVFKITQRTTKGEEKQKKVVTFSLCVQCADNIHRAAVAAARKNDENGKQ